MSSSAPEPAVPTATRVPSPPSNVSLTAVAALLLASVPPAVATAGLLRLMRLPHSASPVADAVLVSVKGMKATPYTAAYVVAAIRRVWSDVQHGDTITKAMKAENKNLIAHRNANRNRASAASATISASRKYGPLLGWKAHMDSHTSAACRAANGHNFYAATGTIIGLPGAVHPHCRCYPVKPFANAGMVNDVVRGVSREEAA